MGGVMALTLRLHHLRRRTRINLSAVFLLHGVSVRPHDVTSPRQYYLYYTTSDLTLCRAQRRAYVATISFFCLQRDGWLLVESSVVPYLHVPCFCFLLNTGDCPVLYVHKVLE